MICLDTETTGINFYRGARPFFVTICNEDFSQWHCEWDVDPLTREVQVNQRDIVKIAESLAIVSKWSNYHDSEIRERHVLVGQNAKFDAHALSSLGVSELQQFPWRMLRDTLLAGHLLASNAPHNLTDMVLQNISIDIQPVEKALETACKQARDLCRRKLRSWMIAKEGLPCMPSAKQSTSSKAAEKDKLWKFDMWLPRAVAKYLRYPPEHPWWNVLRDYSNTDSVATLTLWKWQKAELERRKLWPIYLESLKLPRIIHDMEVRGVTGIVPHVDKLRTQYEETSEKCRTLCITVSDGAIQKLPVNGVSNDLRHVIFDKFGLKSSRRTDSGGPSMDKYQLEDWLLTLPRNEKPYHFIKSLRTYRKRQTALGYIESYEKFMDLVDERVFRIYPSLNQTATDTLRMSSSNPNSQQLSKQEIRTDEEDATSEVHSARFMFGPAPGREWWSLDAKNIELRIPAYASGEQAMIDLFVHEVEPPYFGSQHLLNFSVVYPEIWAEEFRAVGLEKVGPHCKKKYASTWYQWCKNGDFAIQYNCGRNQADRTFHRAGSYDKLKSRFAKLEALNQKCIQQATRLGYVETLPDKSVDPSRGYPLLCTRTEYGKPLPTVPLSYFVQGSAMWWTRRAMVRVEEFLSQLNNGKEFNGQQWLGGYYITLQVHDELVLDFPSGSTATSTLGSGKSEHPHLYNTAVINECRRLMSLGGDDMGFPQPVGCEYHANNWGEGVTLR